MQALRNAIGNLAGILIGLLEVIGAALALLAVLRQITELAKGPDRPKKK